MSIIITEEDLCKKHAKKCARFCQFSSLPSKCFQAANDPNSKNDSKPHISPYNYNTRTGFRDPKKILGTRVLSSALLHTGVIVVSSLYHHCNIIVSRYRRLTSHGVKVTKKAGLFSDAGWKIWVIWVGGSRGWRTDRCEYYFWHCSPAQ